MTTSDRPQPLLEAASGVTLTEGLPMAVCTALVSGGLISLNAGNLITGLYGLVPGALALVAAVLGARRVATIGTPLVTPVSDPQNNAGQRLVPDFPTPLIPPPSPPLMPPNAFGPGPTPPPLRGAL